MVLTKYRCSVCGYVYDPALGDPEGGIKPGVPFNPASSRTPLTRMKMGRGI